MEEFREALREGRYNEVMRLGFPLTGRLNIDQELVLLGHAYKLRTTDTGTDDELAKAEVCKKIWSSALKSIEDKLEKDKELREQVHRNLLEVSKTVSQLVTFGVQELLQAAEKRLEH
jgi:hypothetical protein